MKHYELWDGGRARWQVRHKASGKAIICGTTDRPIRKPEAEKIAALCERLAPTDDPRAAAEALMDAGLPERLRNWRNPRFQAHTVDVALAGL